MKLIPAIICGGSGTRLWPVSRSGRPKPFMKLDDSGSLLQHTIMRVQAIPGVEEVLVVTANDLLRPVLDEIRKIVGNRLKFTFILEPSARGTAAAIAAAALHCREAHGENAVMLVLPADNVVDDSPAMAEVVDVAMTAAQEGRLVTFGINPTSAHDGYGYIEVAASDGDRSYKGWLLARQFVEKPNRETAEAYVASGNYVWNSGMFCFTPKVLIEEMRRCCPQILQACEYCMTQSIRSQTLNCLCVELDGASFATVPKDTIDFAVMEKSRNIVVVPCHFGWSDIGSWSAIADLAPKDENGNSSTTTTIFQGSSNNYVSGTGREIALVGIDDVIVVDTADALLVVHKSKTQEVKHICMQSLTSHEIRATGNSENTRTLATEGDFKVVRIEIDIGEKISNRSTAWPGATWIVTKGTARVKCMTGEVKDVGRGDTHKTAADDAEIENSGAGKLILIAVRDSRLLD